jgi:hypothetical protein
MPTDLNRPCKLCHHVSSPNRLELFTTIEVSIYRSAFIIVMILELSKYVKHLLTGW